jgi:hypothetical protein
MFPSIIMYLFDRDICFCFLYSLYYFVGVGSSFAVVTGIIIAVTTCRKPINKTVILYSKLPDGQTDKVQLLGQDILDDD